MLTDAEVSIFVRKDKYVQSFHLLRVSTGISSICEWQIASAKTELCAHDAHDLHRPAVPTGILIDWVLLWVSQYLKYGSALDAFLGRFTAFRTDPKLSTQHDEEVPIWLVDLRRNRVWFEYVKVVPSSGRIKKNQKCLELLCKVVLAARAQRTWLRFSIRWKRFCEFSELTQATYVFWPNFHCGCCLSDWLKRNMFTHQVLLSVSLLFQTSASAFSIRTGRFFLPFRGFSVLMWFDTDRYNIFYLHARMLVRFDVARCKCFLFSVFSPCMFLSVFFFGTAMSVFPNLDWSSLFSPFEDSACLSRALFWLDLMLTGLDIQYRFRR
jgi:hypothetical protein